MKNISKVYLHSKQKVTALHHVNLEIKNGEFIAIIGASGSGKSTLMNLLGCLDMPDAGEYYINGVNINHLCENELSELRNKNIGFVFQSFHLIQTLTALENVALPLSYQGIAKKKRLYLAEEMLKKVGLSERKYHFPMQLSGGQQQRTAIARAMVTNPKILLADEPTGNLDSKCSMQILKLIKRFHQQNRTIILITHDDKVALQTDKIIKIKDGQLFMK